MLRRTNEWGWILSSWTDGTRPVSTLMTSVTPAQNAFGSYAQLISGAALINDVYEITIFANNGSITATARDILVRIGLDPAGGTAYTALVDLLVGPVYPYASGHMPGGWRFPLFIKAGTSIGAAASVSSVSVTAMRVGCTVKGRPSRPDRIYAGSYIDAFGVTTATSNGTSVTPGTVSEGAWSEIGTLTRPAQWIEYGYSVGNATMNDAYLHVDVGIGDVTNKKIAISNSMLQVTSIEGLIRFSPAGVEVDAATGDKVYVRAQDSGTLETGHTAAVYCVGG